MKGRYLSPAQVLAARKRAELTQAAAAALCGVDKRTWQRWEGGEVKRIREAQIGPVLNWKRGA